MVGLEDILTVGAHQVADAVDVGDVVEWLA